MGAGRRFIAALLALTAVSGAHAAQPLQIQFAEPAAVPSLAGNGHFDAYGRQFALRLENNERLLAGLPVARKAQLASIRVLRGSLEGITGSWVRLTASQDSVTGAIWDGTDLYLVARYEQVRPFLIDPLDVGPSQTVVYRLSDTTNLLPPNFCATEPDRPDLAANNGLVQYKALVRELKLQFVSAPTDQLDISMIADSALAQMYSGFSPPSNDLPAAMLNALNVVDGIYDSQIGLMISASVVQLVPAAGDPFVDGTSQDTINQLRTYRAGIPELRAKPITHLITSHILDGGSTLGIGALSGACDSTNGVSVTSVGAAGILASAPFIMAHEIGHNLSAQHDTGACDNNNIMAPAYSSSIQPRFSQCSVDAIKAFVVAHRGSCITSPMYGDLAARIDSVPDPLRTEQFTWPLYVRNAGTADAPDAVAYIDLRYEDIGAVRTTQGTCAPYNGSMRCLLGNIPAGNEVRIELDITPRYSGDTLNLSVQVDGPNDRYENNNHATASVTVKPPSTVALSVTPTSASAPVGDVVPYTFTLAASGPRDARDMTLSLSDSGYVQYVSLTPSQGSCAGTSCTLGTIPTGSSATVVAQVRGQQGQKLQLFAQAGTSNAMLGPQPIGAELNATATYDIGISPMPSTTVQYVGVGIPFDIVMPFKVFGTKPVSGAVFHMAVPGATIISVTGANCATDVFRNGTGCTLNTMNPGDTQTITVRAQFDQEYQTLVNAFIDNPNDELWTNNSVLLTYYARQATDVSIQNANNPGAYEGKDLSLAATLRSQGAFTANDVSVTFDVAAGVRIKSGTLEQGTCTVISDTRITCARATLPTNTDAQVQITATSDQPGTYTGNWTVSATNDGVPGNNVATSSLVVFPLADVGINPISAPISLVVGTPREFTVEVFTGSKRPVDNVVITFPATQSMQLDSIATPVGTCVLTGSSPHCDLGTLPAGSLLRLTPRYTALTPGTGLSGWVTASATRDFDSSNNNASIIMNTYDGGDVELRVAAPTITGTVGSNVVMPKVTLNAISRSYDVRVSIPIPTFATVASVSGAGICTGAATLDCYLGQLEPGTSSSIDVTLNLVSSGTFTSNVAVRAANDIYPANDTATIEVHANAAAVTPPPAPTPTPSPSVSSSSGGGGGGGGRFEWWSAALLGILLANRLRRT